MGDRTAYRPKLRADVVFQSGDDRSFLYDPLLDRRVDLGAAARSIVRFLDGTRTVDDVAAAVDAENAERTVRTLLLVGLIEGAGDETRARIERLRSGAERLGYAVLDGTRFECQGSGECCQNYRLGPLTDEDVARIRALDVAAALPQVGPGPYVVEHERGPGKGTSFFLRTRDERCVFLLDDHRCGIHAAFGAEAKPGLCRKYPIEEIATIDGIRVYDKGSCATFAKSSRRGLPLVEQLPRLSACFDEEKVLYHPIVELGGGVLCDYAHFLSLTRAQIALVRRGLGSSAETLRAVARAARELGAALGSFPIEPGEPEATTAATTARVTNDPDRFYAAADPDAARAGAIALADVAGALLVAATEVIAARHAQRQTPLTTRLARELAQLLHLIQGVAAHAADPSEPLSEFYAEVAARPCSGPEHDEVLRSSIAQQLFGWRALVDDALPPAILRIAMTHAIAVFGAKLRAVVERRPAAVPDDLSFGHMLAARAMDLGGGHGALHAHQDRAWAIAEGLPSLLHGEPR